MTFGLFTANLKGYCCSFSGSIYTHIINSQSHRTNTENGSTSNRTIAMKNYAEKKNGWNRWENFVVVANYVVAYRKMFDSWNIPRNMNSFVIVSRICTTTRKKRIGKFEWNTEKATKKENTNFAYEFKWTPLFIFQWEISLVVLCCFYSLTAFASLKREKSIAKLLRYLACESALKISRAQFGSRSQIKYMCSHAHKFTIDIGHWTWGSSPLNGICLWLFSSQELCSIQIRPWILTVERAHTLCECGADEWVRSFMKEIFTHETHSWIHLSKLDVIVF